MELLSNNRDKTLLITTNHTFKTDLGWEDSAKKMDEEILNEIINPIENYETVRYIHSPYEQTSTVSGTTFSQTDIWFNFYFLNDSGNYEQNYENVGMTMERNSKMLRETTKSFFRLEFYKTDNNEDPTTLNRRLVFAKNLLLPVGEKIFYTGIPSGSTLPFNDFIYIPVFIGSNYRNSENMYIFWFVDETPFNETNLIGDTFYFTAKFYNEIDGSVIDFTNKNKPIGDEVNENQDMYYKMVINKSDFSYIVYEYQGSTGGSRVGITNNPINFYERR